MGTSPCRVVPLAISEISRSNAARKRGGSMWGNVNSPRQTLMTNGSRGNSLIWLPGRIRRRGRLAGLVAP